MCTVVGGFRFRETPKQIILESILRMCLGNFSGYLLHISKDKASRAGIAMFTISNSKGAKGVCSSQLNSK